jgi:hypothetical protein
MSEYECEAYRWVLGVKVQANFWTGPYRMRDRLPSIAVDANGSYG